ncbi:MAG TPA: LytR C-terminal domain-containing protein [Caulobacteraceae bacterium]
MELRSSQKMVVSALLATSLAGCAGLHARQHWAAVRPIAPAPANEHQVSDADAYYLNASSAIYRRDYALALDLLQIARMKKPDDVRVLNAFGVVYDKLGRFDLSARYYGQAAVLDPGSAIVSANMAYSLALQGKASVVTALASATPANLLQSQAPAPSPNPRQQAASAPPAPVTVLAATSPTDPAPTAGRVVVIGPGVVRLELPSSPPPIRALAALTGHPLILINASGRADGAEPLRTQLVNLGWSAPRAEADRVTARQTTIRYPAQDVMAARALARTLPGPAQLAACDDGCQNIRLVLGSDALGWKLNAHALATGKRRS